MVELDSSRSWNNSSSHLLGYCCCSRRRWWQPTPVLLPGKSRGQRSLVGCSPWGRTESDTTERLHFHFSLSWIGEGNGDPLQCSCLENPRDGGAWWAAIYWVTQSQTWLKWLNSSSSSSSCSVPKPYLTLSRILLNAKWLNSSNHISFNQIHCKCKQNC